MGFKVLINGELLDKEDAKISVFDHGVLYGDGVFEGIRTYNRRVFRFDEHIDRLYASADAIRLKIPISKDAFKDDILRVLKINDLDNGYIRVVVTRGEGDLGLDPRKCAVPTIFVIADKISLYPEEFYKNGLPVTVAKTRRNHPDSLDPRVKSLNYLNNILARVEATDAGVEEALMLSLDGYVVECTGDNIFAVKDGKLLTPPCEIGALKGITRDLVIELAKKRGIGTEYKKMLPEELYDAEECFLTGTAAEIIPVVRIDDHIIGDGSVSGITKQLRQDFRELVKNDGTAY